jgi:putative endonuclease
MVSVYILYSEKRDRYYTGHTNDLQRRIDEHNNGHTKSTRSGIPWKICHTESYNSKSEAIKRERELKRMKSRIFIEELIKNSG